MHNNKVYTILHHFDKNDFKQFNKYINSPYFNKSKLLIQYYELLEKQIHSANPDEFPKEKFWKKLFSPLKYNDVRFRKLSSDLLKLIESFLAQQIYETQNLQKAAYLIESLGSKGIGKLYRTTMNSVSNSIEKYPYKDSDFYLKKYLIEKSFYEITQHEFKHSDRQNLEDIDDNLNKFYLSEKLRYHCAVLSQQQRGTHIYNLTFIDEVLDLIKKYNIDEISALAIYYQIYLTYLEEDKEENYFILKDLLKSHGMNFQSIEAKNLYDSAINYCAKKLNQGKSHFLQEVFDVYEDFLNKEAIYINDELDPFHFKNIIIVSLRLGKYQWTEDFINENKSKLPENARENAYTFNMARLHWYKKEHDKVISLLQEVEYDDIVYNLSSKVLLLTTYYEIQETESLYSLIDSFRAYINRRKDIPDGWKKSYLNFIKFVRRLIRIIPGQESELEKLKSEIKNTENINSVGWLKEKIAELE